MAQLEEVNLATFLTLTPSTFLYRPEYEAAPLILLVKFAGLYREGSEGAPDAHFISAVRDAALYHFMPDGLILDFAELDYKWGDEMEDILPGDDAVHYWRHTPVAVVVGPECREAIRTVIFGLNSPCQLSEMIWAKESLEEALAFIEPCAAARKLRDR